jgi:hypothetical protein
LTCTFAGISDAIPIAILLVRIGGSRAVVIAVEYAILIVIRI